MGYYLATKKNEIMPFAETQMDLEFIILSEVNQKKINTVWYHLHGQPKQGIQMNLFINQK